MAKNKSKLSLQLNKEFLESLKHLIESHDLKQLNITGDGKIDSVQASVDVYGRIKMSGTFRNRNELGLPDSHTFKFQDVGYGTEL